MSDSLLDTNKMTNLIRTMQSTPEGYAIAEVGVYKGGSLIQLAKNRDNVLVYGFDTFKGMPTEFYAKDEFHRPGEFFVTLNQVKETTATYPNIRLVQGVFPESVKGDDSLDKKQFSFVHLDMDHWRGTEEAFKWFSPRMVKGGIIMFDDYGWQHCPGIKPLVDKLAEEHKLTLVEFHGTYQATLSF